jgi:hypothetical protein
MCVSGPSGLGNVVPPADLGAAHRIQDHSVGLRAAARIWRPREDQARRKPAHPAPLPQRQRAGADQPRGPGQRKQRRRPLAGQTGRRRRGSRSLQVRFIINLNLI